MSYDLPFGLNQSDIDKEYKEPEERQCEHCKHYFFINDHLTNLCEDCEADFEESEVA